ncbi:hypothetical protein SESBI_22650 [Sesbania bispinosa]|nr:hypothetical protein SESBI_22650 [Sesbania bispinosa]
MDAWHELLKGKRSANRKKTTWICPHAQKQTGNTECGFYVMRHMLNIVWATITDSWNKEIHNYGSIFSRGNQRHPDTLVKFYRSIF